MFYCHVFILLFCAQFAARMKFEFFMYAFRNNFVLLVSVYTFFIYAKKKVHKGVDVFSSTN